MYQQRSTRSSGKALPLHSQVEQLGIDDRLDVEHGRDGPQLMSGDVGLIGESDDHSDLSLGAALWPGTPLRRYLDRADVILAVGTTTTRHTAHESDGALQHPLAPERYRETLQQLASRYL